MAVAALSIAGFSPYLWAGSSSISTTRTVASAPVSAPVVAPVIRVSRPNGVDRGGFGPVIYPRRASPVAPMDVPAVESWFTPAFGRGLGQEPDFVPPGHIRRAEVSPVFGGTGWDGLGGGVLPRPDETTEKKEEKSAVVEALTSTPIVVAGVGLAVWKLITLL